MILWKIWFDLRFRFFFCLSFLILTVLFMIVIFPMLGTFLSWAKAEISPEEFKLIHPYTTNYRLFMDEGWFREVQFVAAFGVILTLGGVMTEQRSRTIYLTLSLPVKRRQWLLYQAGLAELLVLVLSIVASLLIILGGFVYGQTYPFMRAVGGTLLLGLLIFPWIGATLAVTSFTQDKLKTALLIFCFWFVTSIFEKIPSLRLWLPQHLLDLLADGPFPWRALIVILVAGVGGLLLAIQRFEQTDY